MVGHFCGLTDFHHNIPIRTPGGGRSKSRFDVYGIKNAFLGINESSHNVCFFVTWLERRPFLLHWITATALASPLILLHHHLLMAVEKADTGNTIVVKNVLPHTGSKESRVCKPLNDVRTVSTLATRRVRWRRSIIKYNCET